MMMVCGLFLDATFRAARQFSADKEYDNQRRESTVRSSGLVEDHKARNDAACNKRKIENIPLTRQVNRSQSREAENKDP